MIKNIKRALFIGAIGVFLTQSAFAISLRIENPKVKLTLARGEVKSGTLGIQNTEHQAALVRVYLEDWDYNQSGTGEKDFFAAGSLENSASEWMSLSSNSFTLPQFGRKEVSYTVSVPEDGVSGTYHAAVFFETLVGETTNEEGAKVLVAARLGTVVTIEIDGTMDKTGVVKDIVMNPPIGNRPVEFTVTFENTGNADIELKGNVMILDSTGLVKGRSELNSINTRGGMTASRNSSWTGKLDPGAYDLIFTFDLGDGQIVTEERTFTI